MAVKSLKLFLWGLLLWPVLINIIGFFSALMDNDEGTGLDFLHMVQMYFPLFSVFFSMSLLTLVRIDERNWVKILSWMSATVYVGCSVYGFFPKEEVIYILTSAISSIMEIAMLFLGGIILLNIFNKLQLQNTKV